MPLHLLISALDERNYVRSVQLLGDLMSAHGAQAIFYYWALLAKAFYPYLENSPVTANFPPSLSFAHIIITVLSETCRISAHSGVLAVTGG